MTSRKSDSEYTSKYNNKRQAERFEIKFYLDDDKERRIYEQLSKEPNRKQLILELLKNHYSDE